MMVSNCVSGMGGGMGPSLGHAEGEGLRLLIST